MYSQLYLQFYLKITSTQGGKKTVQRRLPLIDLCWKSQLWVDFKIEAALIVCFITSAAGQEKVTKNLHIGMKK